MIEEVQVLQVEPIPTAVVRRCAPQNQLSKVIPAGCGEVWKFIRQTGLAHSGLNMALYFDGVINLECGVIVKGPFAGDGSVFPSQIPGGLVATVAYYGPYNQLSEAHGAVLAKVQAEGHTLAGPSWEIYGHWNDDPTQLRTDVFYLLAS